MVTAAAILVQRIIRIAGGGQVKLNLNRLGARSTIIWTTIPIQHVIALLTGNRIASSAAINRIVIGGIAIRRNRLWNINCQSRAARTGIRTALIRVGIQHRDFNRQREITGSIGDFDLQSSQLVWCQNMDLRSREGVACRIGQGRPVRDVADFNGQNFFRSIGVGCRSGNLNGGNKASFGQCASGIITKDQVIALLAINRVITRIAIDRVVEAFALKTGNFHRPGIYQGDVIQGHAPSFQMIIVGGFRKHDPHGFTRTDKADCDSLPVMLGLIFHVVGIAAQLLSIDHNSHGVHRFVIARSARVAEGQFVNFARHRLDIPINPIGIRKRIACNIVQFNKVVAISSIIGAVRLVAQDTDIFIRPDFHLIGC